MKIHKMICLDPELVEKLKGQNASSLLNQLLKEHYARTENPYELMSQEELKFESDKLGIELKASKALDALKKKVTNGEELSDAEKAEMEELKKKLDAAGGATVEAAKPKEEKTKNT